MKNILVCHTGTEESPVAKCKKPFPVSQKEEGHVFPVGRECAEIAPLLTLMNPTLPRPGFSPSNKRLCFPHSVSWPVHLTVRRVLLIYVGCIPTSKPTACCHVS